MLISCNRADIKVQRVVQTFEALWKKDLVNYIISGRDVNKYLLIRPKCDFGYMVNYQPEKRKYEYQRESNEPYPAMCYIDLEHDKILDLLKLFDQLQIIMLDSRDNRYGIVQLLVSSSESIYYIPHYDHLPSSAVEWLEKKNAKIIKNRFFYVRGTNSFWSEI